MYYENEMENRDPNRLNKHIKVRIFLSTISFMMQFKIIQNPF